MDGLKFDIEFPKEPSFEWPPSSSVFEDYRIVAFCEGIEAGSLTMTVLKKDNNDFKNSEGKIFWYNTSILPYYESRDENLFRPVIIDRVTKSKFREKGLQRKLIISANEFAKEKFQNPLHSDITFKEKYQPFLLSTWNHLVENKLAFKYEANGQLRYGMY